MNAKNAMLFWILYFISIIVAVVIATHMSATILGLVLFFLLFLLIFTAIDIIVMGFLSLIFSGCRLREISTIYPLVRLDEETITYRSEDKGQITIPRSAILKTKKADIMDKLEIVNYLPNLTVSFWLWDIVEYESEYNLLLRKGEE